MTRPAPRNAARPTAPRAGSRASAPTGRPRTRPSVPTIGRRPSASDARRRADQPARSLSQRVRSKSSAGAASAAERKLRETTSRDSAKRRPIKPGDVADRYRPDRGASRPGVRTKGDGAPVRTGRPSVRDGRTVGPRTDGKAVRTRPGTKRDVVPGDRAGSVRTVDPRSRGKSVRGPKALAPTRTRPGTRPGTRSGTRPGARPGTVGRATRPAVRDRRRVERSLAPITARPGRSPIRAGARRPDRSVQPVRPVGSAWRRSGRFNLHSGLFATTLGWNTWGGVYYGAPFGCWWNQPFFGGSFCWPATRWCNFGGFGLGIRHPWSWTLGGQACYWYTPFFGSSVNYIVIDDPAPAPAPEVIYVDDPQEVWPAEVQGEAVVPAGGGEIGATDAYPAGDVQPLGTAAGGAPAAAPEATSGPDLGTDSGLQRELNRASAYYLTQGDRSFRGGRYGDAAHYYAKSVEFAPDSGILYLVLSDALFATGDYRYAAYAIRQAAEREPSLFQNVIDKRDFYSNPRDFEEQLRTLERFVGDHLLDMDARLVLATNYLFGGRAAEAVDLLENPFSEELVSSDGGKLMLAVAREALAPADAGTGEQQD